MHAALHANMNRTKGAPAVSPASFMPLADGPLAPPEKPPAAAEGDVGWGDKLRDHLGRYARNAARPPDHEDP